MIKNIFKNFGKYFLVLTLILSLCLSICSCDIAGLFVDSDIDDYSDNGSDPNSSKDDGGTSENGDKTNTDQSDDQDDGVADSIPKFDLSTVPEYSGERYVIINNNVPFFTEKEKKHKISYEIYNDRDSLGRCTLAVACIGKDIMPTEPRKSISSVKPTGWINKTYPTILGSNTLYNRSHLIAHSLTGENANRENLITGTNYMNQGSMTEFEDMVLDYMRENTKNHVIYRVTPIFEGDNLLASGVLMEAYSVEDEGDGICFNVYLYNVQPGVIIDYATGESRLAD